MHETDISNCDIELLGPFEQVSSDLPADGFSGFEELISIVCNKSNNTLSYNCS